MFVTHLAIFVVALFGQGLCYTTANVDDVGTISKYTIFKEQTTWDEARDYCEKHGLALAYIMTVEEQNDLRKFVRKNDLLPKDETSGYWLGARANGTAWLWDYNKKNPRDDNFMAGWHWYKPAAPKSNNNVLDNECMELQYIHTNDFDKSLSWNNILCNEKRGFVCQIIDVNMSHIRANFNIKGKKEEV